MFSYSKDNKINDPLIKEFFCFHEIKQNFLGVSKSGNKGKGLGVGFAENLFMSIKDIFNSPTKESYHFEKIYLLKDGIGKDKISDFLTNIIKKFLLEFTETFAKNYLKPTKTENFMIEKVIFDYSKQE